MKKLLIGALVGLLVLSATLVAGIAAAEGTADGTFPMRSFLVTRSPPGGPKSDTYTTPIPVTETGSWWVTLDSLAGSAVIVQVWESTGGVPTLVSSSKVRMIGQSSTPVLLMATGAYSAAFVPYGKAGTSVLSEHFQAPSAPVACFTYSPASPTTSDDVSFSAACSTDADGDIRSYEWDFTSDGIVDATGATAVKRFAAGTYTVTLKVTDSTGLSDSDSQMITVQQGANNAPVAAFTVSRDLMSVAVDGSASSDLEGPIASYLWNWGDSTSSSGPTATHTYTAAGKYTITLTVQDSGGLTDTESKDVTVSTTTIDFSYHDFFNVPYGEWWDMRTFVYGDKPTLADCFNADGIANGYCAPSRADWPDVEAYPYTNWYPSPVDATGKFAFIYAPYRFDAQVKNDPAFTVDQPVILPTCQQLQAAGAAIGAPVTCQTSSPAGGSISIDLYLQYMNIAREVELATLGCPDLTGLNDGFLIEETIALRLDATAAAKLFGVTDPAQLSTLVRAGCGSASSRDTLKSSNVERAYAQWLLNEGNGAYEIYASFEYSYTVLFLEISASYDTSSGAYSIVVHSGTWGEEVLLGRKFYWGATHYIDGVENAAVAPAGWWGMELAWFEDLRLVGTIGSSFSAALSGVMQYHFQHGAEAGPDGSLKTQDDVPIWQWQPILSDYIYGFGGHPYSELDRYLGYEYVHTTPGSKNYGLSGAYDYAPQIWTLKAGETQSWVFPLGSIQLFDPFLSVGTTDGSGLVSILAPIRLSSTAPAGYVSYDLATNSAWVLGPTSTPMPGMTAGGFPLESRPILNLK